MPTTVVISACANYHSESGICGETSETREPRSQRRILGGDYSQKCYSYHNTSLVVSHSDPTNQSRHLFQLNRSYLRTYIYTHSPCTSRPALNVTFRTQRTSYSIEPTPKPLMIAAIDLSTQSTSLELWSNVALQVARRHFRKILLNQNPRKSIHRAPSRRQRKSANESGCLRKRQELFSFKLLRPSWHGGPCVILFLKGPHRRR